MDQQEYATIWEMQTRLIKKGIPVEHLEHKQKLIEHHATGDLKADNIY